MEKAINKLTVSEFGDIIYQGVMAMKKDDDLSEIDESAILRAQNLLRKIWIRIDKDNDGNDINYKLYGSIYLPYLIYRTKIQSPGADDLTVEKEVTCLFKNLHISTDYASQRYDMYCIRVDCEDYLRKLVSNHAISDWNEIGDVQIKDVIDELARQGKIDKAGIPSAFKQYIDKYTACTTAKISDVPDVEEIDPQDALGQDVQELKGAPVYKQKDKNLTDAMLLDQIMEQFESYNLTDGSRRELRNFFTFKINYGKRTEKTTVRYNLLVECDNIDMMKDFLEAVNQALLNIDDSQRDALIMSEEEWSGSNRNSPNPNQTFWGIYDCKAPYSTEGNMSAGSKERERADEEKLKKDQFWDILMSNARDADEQTMIAVGTRDFIEYMHKDENKFFRFFAHHIYLEPQPAEKIIEATDNELKAQGFEFDKSFETGIKKYIQTVYPKAELHDEPFVQDLVNRVLANYYVFSSEQKLTQRCVPYYRKTRSYDDISAELNSLVGLSSVKKEFEKLYRLAQDKKQVNRQNLHFIFEGNPGTGKTTVAKMTAELLYTMGLIEKNKIVPVSRKDIIGVYIGDSGQNMRTKIHEAYGGVLFIDEAYFLAYRPGDAGGDFSREALEVLVDEMENSIQGNNSNKFTVILAGYKKEMERLLASNTGLESRIGYRFEFEDYTDEELLQIFIDMAAKEDMALAEDAHDVMLERIAYARTQPGFGNARTISTLYQQLKSVWMEKGREERVITAEDIRDTMPTPISVSLDEMVGLDEVKDQLNIFESRVKYLKFLKDHDMGTPPQNMHMMFRGNPGTGKTTVAQKIADCLYHIGVLKTNKLIVAERKNLAVPGAAGISTEQYIEKAKNGVLFIDEAYSLARPGDPSDPGREVIETLITAMEKYKDCLVVIFAGYSHEMDQFLDINPGIKSRIGFIYDFPDYTTEQLTDMFCKKMDKYGFSLSHPAVEKAKQDIDFYKHERHFGNGRFVDQMIDKTISKRSCRTYSEKSYKQINEPDVPDIKELANGDNVITDEDISEELKRRTAIHEAGHALVAELMGEEEMITGASVKAEVDSLGRVSLKRGQENRTESDLRGELAVLFAGRDAEKVALGEQATGCESDISIAKYLAHLMIEDSAMGEFGVTTEQDLLMEADQTAIQELDEHKRELKEIADCLLEKEELSGEELKKFCEKIMATDKS